VLCFLEKDVDKGGHEASGSDVASMIESTLDNRVVPVGFIRLIELQTLTVMIHVKISFLKNFLFRVQKNDCE
jgi:hypothetical protein